jgi:hypothetical protein
MDRASDYHLMDSHSIHHPEKSLLLFSLQTPFWRKCRKFIGNNPDPPSFTICRTALSIGKGFMGGEVFVARAKRTVRFINGFFYGRFDLFKIVRSL